jgi:hypothetical protein
VDDDDFRSDRVQRPGPPAAAGQGRRQTKRQVDWARGDAATPSPSSATGRPSS